MLVYRTTCLTASASILHDMASVKGNFASAYTLLNGLSENLHEPVATEVAEVIVAIVISDGSDGVCAEAARNGIC